MRPTALGAPAKTGDRVERAWTSWRLRLVRAPAVEVREDRPGTNRCLNMGRLKALQKELPGEAA